MKRPILLGLCVVALALLIAGTAVNSWVKGDAGGGATYNGGLWAGCETGNGCSSYSQSCIGKCASGSDLTGCSNLPPANYLARDGGKGDSLGMILGGVIGVSFVFTLIGFAIGTAVAQDSITFLKDQGLSGAKLDAGVALTCVSWILQLFAVGVAFGMPDATKA